MREGQDGQAAGELNFLWDVAVSPNGLAIYVSDYFNRRINQYEPDGDFVRSWGEDVIPGGSPGFEACTAISGCKAGVPSAEAGALDRPGGITVGPSGDVYVTESMNDRVSQFTATGEFVRAWGWDVDPAGGAGFETCTTATTCREGLPGVGEGQMSNSFAIGVDAAGNVLASSGGSYINRHSSEGAYLGRFGGPGVSGLSEVRSIDVGPSGEILTTQTGSPKGIFRFGADFALLELFSPSQNLPDTPTDASFAPDGSVYTPQFNSLTAKVVKYGLSPPSGPPPPPPPPPSDDPPAPAPPPASPPASPPVVARPVVPLALPKASAVIVLPSTRSCVSRRSFRIRLKQPKGLKIRTAIVSVDGKRVVTVTARRVTAPVDLRGLPKGRFTVKIAVTLTDGRKLASTRRYRTCRPRRS